MTVAPVADVRITKVDADGASTAGEFITYTLRVENLGPSVAENVTVQDPLPAQVTYVAATPAPVSGLPTAPVWALGALQPGGVTTITLVVRSASDAAAGLLLRNTAIVTSTTFDPNLANNSSTAQSQVFGLADVEVNKVASTAIVTGGETITYTIP